MQDHDGRSPEALEGRNGEVWQLYSIKRWTQERIAAHLGISQQRVSQIVAKVREALPPTDLAEMRTKSAELYADLTRRAYEIADLIAAPVFVGKDGDVAIDPESGEVVRDYAGRMKALELAAKFDAETRKLFGLDSPTKLESTNTVKYVLEGVDTNDLT